MADAGGPQIFKDKEELEDFLQNLGIEYRYSCYSEKNPEGCYLLGDFLQIIKSDYEKAAQAYRWGCLETDSWKCCNQYGTYRFLGRGVKKNISDAVKFFEKSCHMGSPEGCFHIGQVLTGLDPKVSAHVKPNPQKAVGYLEKGCELGCANSCHTVTGIHSLGLDNSGGNSVPINHEAAFKYAKKGCDDYRHFESCANLALMYRKGLGTPKNPELAKKAQEVWDDYIDAVTKGRGSVEFGQGAD